jgi:hypothetical protein
MKAVDNNGQLVLDAIFSADVCQIILQHDALDESVISEEA